MDAEVSLTISSELSCSLTCLSRLATQTVSDCRTRSRCHSRQTHRVSANDGRFGHRQCEHGVCVSRARTFRDLSSQPTRHLSSRVDADGDQIMLTAANNTQFTQSLLLFVRLSYPASSISLPNPPRSLKPKPAAVTRPLSPASTPRFHRRICSP